jgi:hypothetical protein
MKTPIEFFARLGDVVVVGQNSESADYDNPRGYVYAEQVVVIAEDANGERVQTVVGTTDEDDALSLLARAERLAAALNARLAAGKLPVAFASWQSIRPCYGSDAYVAHGQADDLAVERIESTDELFA